MTHYYIFAWNIYAIPIENHMSIIQKSRKNFQTRIVPSWHTTRQPDGSPHLEVPSAIFAVDAATSGSPIHFILGQLENAFAAMSEDSPIYLAGSITSTRLEQLLNAFGSIAPDTEARRATSRFCLPLMALDLMPFAFDSISTPSTIFSDGAALRCSV